MRLYFPIRAIACTLLLITLSGCQSNPLRDSLAQVSELLGINSAQEDGAIEVVEEPTNALSKELNQFITHAAPGDSSAVNQTPWGNNLQLTAGQFYTAASGRRCRVLQVANSSEEPVNKHLVCEKSEENWVTVRAITRHN